MTDTVTALLRDFCLAAECAAGCAEGVTPDIARDEILSSMGSPMAVAYVNAREHITRTDGGATTPMREAEAETRRLQGELDITNADHVALWIEANLIPDEPMSQCVSWFACRIVEAHERALAALSTAQVDETERLREALETISEVYDKWDSVSEYAVTALFRMSKIAKKALAALTPSEMSQ